MDDEQTAGALTACVTCLMVATGHVSEVPIWLGGRGQSDASRSLMGLGLGKGEAGRY